MELLEQREVPTMTERLDKYLFPVEESEVYYLVPRRGLSLMPTFSLPQRTLLYKAILRTDTQRLISIMPRTYKLVPNSEVILPLMEELDRLEHTWYIDTSHSFSQSNRMRLQVTFPEITVRDDEQGSDIALSMFIHNSYDGSEGVRFFFGGINGICSNGQVYGEVLGKFYRKHTAGFQITNLRETLDKAIQRVPVLQHRIHLLEELEMNSQTYLTVEEKMGATVKKYVDENLPSQASMWTLYNLLTYYVSHEVEKRLRAGYQMKISKMFNL